MKRDPTLTEQAEQQILQYVTQKGYKIGDTFPKESEFAEILGVSRVVIREALSRLRMMGFIETKRKRGTVLKSPDMFYGVKTIVNSGKLDLESLKDLYEVRIMLEIGMADFIFMRKTQESIKQLEDIVANEDATDVNDLETLARLDIQFHTTLYKMSGNKSLGTFQNLLNTLFTTYSRSKNWRSRQIISHAALVGILQKGTTDAFRTAMRLHLNTRFEDMETLFAPEKNKLIEIG
ncbi:MAG: FadR/GntR family transcriptional regulator [Ginsengibacter sp.]